MPLVALGLIAGAIVWLGFSENGFRWLAARAAVLSGGRVVVENVSGHLGRPLVIGRLVFAGEFKRVELEGVRLEWRPGALWQRRLEIELLAAQRLEITVVKPAPTPPALPDSLRLPFAVTAQTIDLARLVIIDAGTQLGFSNLRARLDDDGRHYRLVDAMALSPWAELGGGLEIAKDAPFALQGRFEAARRAATPLTASLRVAGELAALDFELEAKARGMHFLARGKAAPFAPIRLPRLVVAGEGLDPRLFDSRAPTADLAFAGVFEGQAGERLIGTFSLDNRLAGRLDQGRLPLTRLTGAVVGDLRQAGFSELLLDLGKAGRFTGGGAWHDGRLSLDLSSPSLDLAGLHRRLYSTRLKTALRLDGDAKRQTLAGEVSATWGGGRFSLSHAAGELRLETADFAGQAGRLRLAGTLGLDPARAFAVDFDASRINPARFGRFPRARLNARGAVSGVLAPALKLEARFSLPPGELEGRPVQGGGRLRYENRHLAQGDLDLDLAGNRARVNGAWGRAGDRLAWEIEAPALARLGFGLGGRLISRGSLSGEPRQPQIAGGLTASGLRLPGGIAADVLNLELDLQAAADGAFNGRLEGRGLGMAGWRLDAVQAMAQGRRDAHRLRFEARLPGWRLNANLNGGLDAGWVWRGQLAAAQAEGPWPAALLAPARLLLSRDRQEAEELAFSFAGGRVDIAHLGREGGRVASRGSFASLPLAPLLARLEPAVPFSTDLRFAGEWDLRLGDSVDGHLRLARQTGDVRFREPALALGLSTFVLELSAAAGRVNASLAGSGSQAGRVEARGQFVLTREGRGFALARSAPLDWTARLDVPDLRIVRPLLPLGVRLDARLAAQLAGSGSLAAPRIDGRISAEAIRFAVPEEGIAISDGRIVLVLAGERVRVESGVLEGRSGRIRLAGEGGLREPEGGLVLDFEQFSASNRSDRRVWVSGTARLGLSQRRLRLEGVLVADRARIEMPEPGRPQLSADVVVLGQPPRPPATGSRVPLDLDLGLGLGEDFQFRGAGLDVRLGGRLRVFTRNGALQGEGRIEAGRGHYSAYGQRLEIERGVLSFAGPLDDPGLDVLAVRKTPTVKAGVQLRGTAQRPLVTLYSEPPLPDGEKLAWLMLGHGLDRGGQQEFALLQLAAGALLSRAESASLQSQIAGAFGLDSFEVRAGEGEDLSSTVVSVGRRLSSRATLAYEQSLDGLNQAVKVIYQLGRHVRVEAKAGQPNSLDVFYSREYD